MTSAVNEANRSPRVLMVGDVCVVSWLVLLFLVEPVVVLHAAVCCLYHPRSFQGYIAYFCRFCLCNRVPEWRTGYIAWIAMIGKCIL